DAQGLEVVVVEFDLRTLDDGEPHRTEDIGDAALQLRDGMQAAAQVRARGQRDIETPALDRRGDGGAAHRLAARIEGGLEFVLERVRGGAGCLALVYRHLPEAAEDTGETALAAEELDAPGVEGGRVRGGGKAGDAAEC